MQREAVQAVDEPALLLCGLIVLCAINPDIEKKLACLVPQKEETVEPALSDPGIAIEEEITARQAKRESLKTESRRKRRRKNRELPGKPMR